MSGTPKKVRIVIKHRGTLGKHGYARVKTLSDTKRQAALLGAVEEYGHTYVIRKLNALAVFNKNRDPALSALFREDIRFVQRLRNAARNTISRTQKRAPPRRRRPAASRTPAPRRRRPRRTGSKTPAP